MIDEFRARVQRPEVRRMMEKMRADQEREL